jgi:23S rRNA (cytidine1920-2'-O)/16S rRNA (cytidine1409-2'-O)-methyltransferase
LPGPAGNVEYFCWLRTDAGEPSESAAHDVVAAGPLESRVTEAHIIEAQIIETQP